MPVVAQRLGDGEGVRIPGVSHRKGYRREADRTGGDGINLFRIGIAADTAADRKGKVCAGISRLVQQLACLRRPLHVLRVDVLQSQSGLSVSLADSRGIVRLAGPLDNHVAVSGDGHRPGIRLVHRVGSVGQIADVEAGTGCHRQRSLRLRRAQFAACILYIVGRTVQRHRDRDRVHRHGIRAQGIVRGCGLDGLRHGQAAHRQNVGGLRRRAGADRLAHLSGDDRHRIGRPVQCHRAVVASGFLDIVNTRQQVGDLRRRHHRAVLDLHGHGTDRAAVRLGGFR